MRFYKDNLIFIFLSLHFSLLIIFSLQLHCNLTLLYSIIYAYYYLENFITQFD